MDGLPGTIPTLTGPVTLRPFRETDVEVVVAAGGDPLIPLITTVPRDGSRDQALAYIARQHARLVEGAGYSFAIADAATGEAVGQIGLWLREIDEGRAVTGYWVSPGHRGRGYARAALQTLADWALALEPVHRLQLYVEPWNEASWRCAEACGFTREGLLRSWQEIGGGRRDLYVYARLRRETGERARSAKSCPQQPSGGAQGRTFR